MSKRHHGSSLDSLLKEEGVFEETHVPLLSLAENFRLNWCDAVMRTGTNHQEPI